MGRRESEAVSPASSVHRGMRGLTACLSMLVFIYCGPVLDVSRRASRGFPSFFLLACFARTRLEARLLRYLGCAAVLSWDWRGPQGM